MLSLHSSCYQGNIQPDGKSRNGLIAREKLLSCADAVARCDPEAAAKNLPAAPVGNRGNDFWPPDVSRGKEDVRGAGRVQRRAGNLPESGDTVAGRISGRFAIFSHAVYRQARMGYIARACGAIELERNSGAGESELRSGGTGEIAIAREEKI